MYRQDTGDPKSRTVFGHGVRLIGKTVITLTAIKQLKYERFQICKALVIAPKKVAEGTWAYEKDKWDHTGDLTVSLVLGSAKKRMEALEIPADIYVINRENVSWLVGHYRNDWPFDMVVVDEASSFKSHTAKRFKSLAAISPHVERTVLLTGTPSPQSIADLWSQIYLLDEGERLCRRFTQFRTRYMEPDLRGPAGVIYSYREKPGSTEAILEKISDICVSMKAEDYLELPDIIYDDVPVILNPKAQRAYREMERKMILELPEGEISAMSAAALSTKLLQISNGAVYDEMRNVHHVHDCKLDAFLEMAESLKDRRMPALVFYQFQHDRDRILKALNEMPRMYAHCLDGPDDVEAWNRGEVDVLLAHPASAAYGLNLQEGGHHVIWFGLTWNYEQYVQANARLYRQGQKDKVIVHHMVCRGTRDEAVLKALTRKEKAQDYVLESLKARIREVKRGRTQ